MTSPIHLSAFVPAGASQHDRLLRLDTPLGEDMLLPLCAAGQERFSSGYEFTVDCLSVDGDIELKRLVAQPVTLWLRQTDRSYLPVHGYVHRMTRLGSDGRSTFCQLSLSCWMHFLKFRKDARIWQDKTADDILCDVFNIYPQAQGNYRFDVRDPATRRSYCTQYETDWHFAQRLMEEEGWYSYHEQSEDGSRHVLVVTDNLDQLKPIAQQQVRFHRAGTRDELDRILHWSAVRSLGSTQYSAQTDDYKATFSPKRTNTIVRPEHGQLPGQLEVYEYTGAYTYSNHAQGDKQARLRIEQIESDMKRYRAVSGVRSLRVGSWFALEDHPVHAYDPDDDREFAVVAIEWSIENNLPFSSGAQRFPGSLQLGLAAFGIDSFRQGAGTGHCFNHIEVQRRNVPYRSAFEHLKPTLHPQTAVVVGPASEEVYTDHLNRVKVQFRWDRHSQDDERASCWVRVSYPNAGQGWGALTVPRIRQEVIVTFLNGDADRPVITGRLYNEEQVPQWHTNGLLSGYKSKEHKGAGFNQLVMDDTTGQNRIHIYSTSANAQLNLGYLVSQSGNQRNGFFGTGFALSTDDSGAVVAPKGLYLSTFGRPGPQGMQLAASEATGQLKAGSTLTKTLSDTAVKAGAEALAGQAALDGFIEATQDRYDGQGQGSANRFKEPALLAGSQAGIALASTKGTHVHAGAEVTVSSGQDTNIAAGKSLLASVAEKISMFAYNAGIKLFSAKGKVEVQAQGNDLDLIAEKVVRLLSTTARVEIHAQEEVLISAGGSFVKINGSGITSGTSGTWTSHASKHSMPGPATQQSVMPHIAKPELEKTDLEFRHLTDWGEPLAGAAYKAILSDGSIRKGILDAAGIARISGVPPGTGAKIEYDYRPLQVISTVSTELDDDIHELLNWVAGTVGEKGQA
ncbi:type VI secretion system Vgr family protein [Pseudoduganella armeniaca]|uniref:Type VI secretion system tip protein VgrG n=1 Tax=Pseudoduganella armeniaca TaxID=2072590 RepID=A0A2R4C873_9BURK|nr:type VI secretion system Vgr family protein [Pseudoduganella armeniaca]AVR95813.1 type VI secretion system tip protein VgrG [Pseudoduganella armeniaca]